MGGGLASEDKMRSVGLSEEQVQIAKVMGLTNEDVDEYARLVDEDPQSLEFDLGGGAQDLAPVGAEEVQEGGLASLVSSGDSLLGGMGGAAVLARIEEYIKEEKQEREFLGEIKEAGEATSQGLHSMTIHGSLGYRVEVSRSGAAIHGPYSIKHPHGALDAPATKAGTNPKPCTAGALDAPATKAGTNPKPCTAGALDALATKAGTNPKPCTAGALDALATAVETLWGGLGVPGFNGGILVPTDGMVSLDDVLAGLEDEVRDSPNFWS